MFNLFIAWAYHRLKKRRNLEVDKYFMWERSLLGRRSKWTKHLQLLPLWALLNCTGIRHSAHCEHLLLIVDNLTGEQDVASFKLMHLNWFMARLNNGGRILIKVWYILQVMASVRMRKKHNAVAKRNLRRKRKNLRRINQRRRKRKKRSKLEVKVGFLSWLYILGCVH